MNKKKAVKKSEKRRKRALKPATICYSAHLDSHNPNMNFGPHVHVLIADYRHRPVVIRWESQHGSRNGHSKKAN